MTVSLWESRWEFWDVKEASRRQSEKRRWPPATLFNYIHIYGIITVNDLFIKLQDELGDKDEEIINKWAHSISRQQLILDRTEKPTRAAILLLYYFIYALIIFSVGIIPIFARLFKTLDVTLPLLTQWVLVFSRIIQSYFVVFLAILWAGGYLLYKYRVFL